MPEAAESGQSVLSALRLPAELASGVGRKTGGTGRSLAVLGLVAVPRFSERTVWALTEELCGRFAVTCPRLPPDAHMLLFISTRRELPFTREGVVGT